MTTLVPRLIASASAVWAIFFAAASVKTFLTGNPARAVAALIARHAPSAKALEYFMVVSPCGLPLYGAKPGSPDFHDVVVERCWDLLEPMRHAIGHDDHVALLQFAALASTDRSSANLVRSDIFRRNRR